jgi:hypothetical protein
MIGNTILPEYLWPETLKIATHVLNRVFNKFVSKIPNELWIGRK